MERKAEEALELLVRFYCHLRGAGYPMDSWEGVEDVPSTLFSALWNWWGVISDPMRDRTVERLAGVHVRVLKDRNTVCRPEFAWLFVVGEKLWWDDETRVMYEGARHGLGEMRLLFEEVEEKNVIKALLGWYRDRTTWAAESMNGEDLSILDLGLSEEQYLADVVPREGHLVAEFKRWVVRGVPSIGM